MWILMNLFYNSALYNFVTMSVSPIVEYKCANGSAKSNLICLLKDLMRDYDRSVRPVAHHSNQTTVYMSVFPLSINSVSWGTDKWILYLDLLVVLWRGVWRVLRHSITHSCIPNVANSLVHKLINIATGTKDALLIRITLLLQYYLNLYYIQLILRHRLSYICIYR